MSIPRGNGVKEPVSPRRAARRESPAKKDTMNGPLYMQGSNNVVLVRRLKRKGDGTWKNLTRWFVENQTGLSFNLIALLMLTHFFFPKSREYTTKFWTLSNYNARTREHRIGGDDGYLVVFFAVLFTGLRASTMEYILAPFAKWYGMTKRKDITRFSEQGWLVIYYVVVWPMGTYLYVNSPYYMSLKNLWTHWPHRDLDPLMKGYMLAQLSFWLQQVLVINIEERRKDHWQMFTHHLVTIALIFASYRYGHTRVGNLILILFDGVDIVFSSAKCLKYLGYSTLCDIAFGLFMASWIVCRHVFYLMVCYSVWKHTPDVMPTACFRGGSDALEGPLPAPRDRGLWYLLEPLVDAEGLVCYDAGVKWGFLSVLLFLQCITLVWLYAIFQVAIKVLRGTGAEDTRSDDEASAGEEEEDEDEMEEEEGGDGGDNPIEEEVGVEELDLKGWERRSGVKRQATTSSGVSLPGHSDRKELLNRIGCEKQID